jgi:Recombinase zinc beta ribbon domain
LLVCGRCGLRMVANYNNNGHASRYSCIHMATSYAEPICQSLKGAPLDALVARLVLQAVEPAALEVSLALAGDLQAERKALDQQWQLRVERARYAVERSRRQYDAVEPENRLVARTLERGWEEALAEQARLEADHEQFQHQQPQAPSPAELAAIARLAHDLPSLWHADTTTQAERQTIVRLLLERVLVEVVDDSEQVRVQCHWHGGHRTSHGLTRPVARLTALSTYAALVARAGELRGAGHGCAEIAERLNQEGWRPAKRRNTFNAQMVLHLLQKAGVVEVIHRHPKAPIPRATDEWTIRELADTLSMPESTLYNWVQQGRLRCRVVPTGNSRAKLVHADAATIARLKAIRTTPVPWRRRPPPVTPSPDPATES